jgi:ferredoxin-type protein NapH
MNRNGLVAQFVRRAFQISVLGFIVYAAMLGHWRNYKLAHNHRRIVGLIEGDGWATLYGLNEDFLALFGESFRTSFAFLGLPWAGRIFGLDTTDPMLVLGQAVTRGADMAPGLWLSVLVPLILAVILGRVFCSYLCPMRLLFELGQSMRSGLLRLGVSLPEWRSASRFGGFVLLGGIVATASAGSVVWLFILPYVSLSASIFLAISAGVASILCVVALTWFLVDSLVAPGFFCHNLCPTGFTLEQASRLSRFRVAKKSASRVDPCPTSCNECEISCPFSLRPKEDLPMSGCDNCGKCVVACPRGKLARQWGPVLAILIAITWSPGVVEAHHNKGLPHYGYFDNYPQVPVEEHVAIDGPWEIGAVIFNFQGLDRRTADTPNDVKIYLYLYDARTHSAYEGPLDVELRNGGKVVSTFERIAPDEEAVYATRETLPRGGAYELVARVGDEEVVLPFEIDLASDKIAWSWVAGIGAPVAIVAGFAAIGRGRSRRKGSRRRRE